MARTWALAQARSENSGSEVGQEGDHLGWQIHGAPSPRVMAADGS